MNSQKQIKLGAVISYAAVFINIIATLLYTCLLYTSRCV